VTATSEVTVTFLTQQNEKSCNYVLPMGVGTM